MRTDRYHLFATLTFLAVLTLIVAPSTRANAQVKQKEEIKKPVRTLEEIKIEGEIDIPQVLFITSRDHPRFSDGLRERYRESALEIGRQVVLPYRFRALLAHPRMQK